MLLVKLYYGINWGCVKGRKTRNNFIAYYRIGLTANFSVIFECLVIMIVYFDVNIVTFIQLQLFLYCAFQICLLHFYLRYLDAIHVAKNDYQRDQKILELYQS